MKLLELHKVQWDLNCQLFWYSEHGDLFDCRMFRYLDAWYLGSLVFDHHLVNWLVFRPPFEYGSAIQMPGTLAPGIWITNHLKNEWVGFSHQPCTTNIKPNLWNPGILSALVYSPSGRQWCTVKIWITDIWIIEPFK